MKKALILAAALFAVASVSKQASANYCAAELYCMNGNYISCSVVGTPDMACNWWVGPNYVHCAGFNAEGMWEVFNIPCGY